MIRYQKKSTAVVTLCMGRSYEDILQLSRPFMEIYAAKIDADFKIITTSSTETEIEYYEKFQLYSLLEDYERILFLDADILVTPKCPNLFEIVPESHFGAFLVSRYSDLHDQAIAIAQELLGDIGWKKDYFNSGVMIFSRMHREVFNYHNHAFKIWSSYSRSHNGTFLDQTLLNYNVFKLKIPVFDIGYKYNHTTAPRNSSQRFRSYIIHYPGKGHRKGDKLEQIRKDAAVLQQPFSYFILSQFPWLTSLIDRLV